MTWKSLEISVEACTVNTVAIRFETRKRVLVDVLDAREMPVKLKARARPTRAAREKQSGGL
jgi:hypothetical protein